MEHPDDVASGIPPLTTNASEPVEVAAAALADNPDNVMEGVIGGSAEARLGGIDVVGGAVLGGTVDEDDEDEDDDDDHSRGSSAGDVDDGGDGATPSSVKKGGRGKRVHRSLPRIKTILQNETVRTGVCLRACCATCLDRWMENVGRWVKLNVAPLLAWPHHFSLPHSAASVPLGYPWHPGADRVRQLPIRQHQQRLDDSLPQRVRVRRARVPPPRRQEPTPQVQGEDGRDLAGHGEGIRFQQGWNGKQPPVRTGRPAARDVPKGHPGGGGDEAAR